MGKGGSTTSVEIPAWLEEAARKNLEKADKISALGSVPMSYGPTVAAFTPMQNASFQNTASLASAYGLNAPTGSAITGGMDAPTDYGGGIMAYSAKPLFDKTMEEFKLDRPGQASYIDSFFIDPYTGQPGVNVNPTFNNMSPVSGGVVNSSSSGGGGSGTETLRGNDLASYLDPNNRMGMRDTMNRTNYAEGISDGALGFAQNNNKDIYAVGYQPGQMSPREAAEKGLTMRDDNPFDYTVGEHFGKIKDDVKSMPGKIAEDVKDGTVMCSAYCKMGYLPKEIWKLDRRYGVKVFREDPTLIEGYHLWGIPTANYIKKNTFFAKIVRALMWPIVKAWAEEMAHCMKPTKYKANYLGKAIKFVGEPFSRLCGKLYKYNVRFMRATKEV